MLTIGSIKGRTEVMYVLAAVAVLLLVVSAVFAYDYSRADGGGANSTDDVRVVVSYDDNMFIDKEGDAKLIYTLVSYDFGNGQTIVGVKITDIERDPRSSSFTTFPTHITDGTTTYEVIGNIVTKDSETLFTDDQGITYQLDSTSVSVEKYSSQTTGASIIIPAKITYYAQDSNGSYSTVSYTVSKVNCNDFKEANISKLTIIVPDVSDYKFNQSFQGNQYLTEVKFVVDNDDPNVLKPEDAGKIDIGSAFKGCSGLTTLTLPNVLHRADNAFDGCTSLGSSETDPLIFNTFLRTKNETNNMFNGCTGLVYLEIGKNVNKVINSDESTTIFSGCNGIKVIYNTSTKITEEDIAKSIVNSGSSKVLLFCISGGEFTQRATLSGSEITMPEGTYDGVEIPSWSHKDGTAMFDSGTMYSSFNPWGAEKTAYSYYYYALYGTCTVTYHVWYKDNNEIKSDVQTQTVVCMYNTQSYDKSTYPNQNLKDKFTDGKYWMVSDSVHGDAVCYYGQSLTLHTDLDLIGYFDDVSYTDVSTITLKIKWSYIDASALTVTTYSKNYSKSYEETFPTQDTFISEGGIPDAIKGLVGNQIIAPNGRAYDFNTGFKFFCDLTLTVISASDEYQKITYSNDQEKVARTFLRYTTIDHIVVAPNTFDRNGAIIPFKYWTRGSTEDYPGDVISCAGTDELKLYPYWGNQNESVSVTYNLYNNGSEYEYKTMTYTYKNILEKLPSDSDTGFSREGYKLIGWSYTEKGNVNFSLETPVTMVNNLRLYAVWVQINQLIVIVDNLLLSADDLPSTYKTTYSVIGTLSDRDSVELAVTYDSSTDPPTTVGVYTMKVEYKVVNTSGKDVTSNYKITVSDSFLTIYSGDHSLVID